MKQKSKKFEAKQADIAHKEKQHSHRKPKFIIGIGASAGGLEALQEFFSHMPQVDGIAFIVVQHLSPDFKSLMDQLLAKFTKYDIHSAEHEMEIIDNSIYLIPPKKI